MPGGWLSVTDRLSCGLRDHSARNAAYHRYLAKDPVADEGPHVRARFTGLPPRATKETTLTMAATLPEILLAPDTQPQVVADCFELIEQEVSDKSGITGTAVKLAYKTVTAFAPGYLRETVEALLPDLVDNLQPFWADFRASGSSEFGDFLVKRSDEVSQALLSVTDARAEASDRPTIVRAYRTVRGGAGKQIEAALPRVGDLVMKYAG